MKQHIILILSAAYMFFPAATAAAGPVADTYEKLSGLVGDWKKADSSNSELIIRFELTAGGTVLMERWMYGEKTHSLTVYHRDGTDLLATHYCPQGNQPRLKLKVGSSSHEIEFKYMDATNLESREQSHQHSLDFKISDTGMSMVRGETYLSKAGLDASKLILTRVEN